ncbi:MAG: VWA domain-containing protein, partial [candidate division KSB1 bacterium]|nr:VWA domain-containing protein [candidate division KSB1 bacterium]
MCGVLAAILLFTVPCAANAQDSLVVLVNNISISGEFSLRGLTAAFPYPVMTVMTVIDRAGNPIIGLADTLRWLGPQDRAENGSPIPQIWKRLLEYHRDNPSLPLDPDLFNQRPGPLFTEVRWTNPVATSTMLVMDVSSSMREELPEAKEGVIAFLDQLHSLDRAGVIQFCAAIRELRPFTNDKNALKANVAAAEYCNGTAIYDALMTAIQETKLENNRRAIILYTDGEDTRSALSYEAVIDSAKFYNIPIFTIALGAQIDTAILQQIAAQTGGLFFQTSDAAEFKAVYERLAALLQNFYVMAHGSPDPVRNGTWRVVDVTIGDPIRPGKGKGEYFVPAGPALQPTDLELTMTSITSRVVSENGRIINAVQPGEGYKYSLRVHNRGPEQAQSIILAHVLPDSVRFIQATASPFYVKNDSLAWQILKLNAGSTDSITVTVQLASQVPQTLQKLISRANIFAANDNSPANNSAADTVRVVFPAPPLLPTDVAVNVTSRTDTTIIENGRVVNATKPGQPYAYTIELRNLGPARAENIHLRQSLPDSVRFISASRTPVAAAGDSLIWQIPQLEAGTDDSITVTVQLAPNVPPEMQLLITKVDLFAANDNSPGNNSATDTVRVVFPAPPLLPTDVAVNVTSRTDTTIIENGRVVNATKPGQPYEYTIELRNLGPARAGNIHLRQSL